MAAVTRNDLHAMIDELGEDGLAAARQALHELSIRARGEDIDRELLAGGVLVSVPAPMAEDVRREFRELTRLTIPGEPVSDTIIEDRRPRNKLLLR